MPTLEALDLAARRGQARLFAGLAFGIDAGEAMIVTGANGTGKTTLLRIIAGLTAASAGEIRWEGVAVAPFDPTLRRATTYNGHEAALKEGLTAAENLASLLDLGGERATVDEIDAALDAVALSAQRKLPARVLSQGQRRRIGLARLRLSRRPLWVLDEPTTALDASGTAMLGEVLRAHLDAGGLAVAATHSAIDVSPSRVRPLALD
jgi:heme exporter protein A